MVKMKVLSFCPKSRYSFLLPRFIIYFITFQVHKVESALFKVIGPHHPISAEVGEDVVLPCHLSPRRSAEDMEVRWFRSKFTSYVHLYRHRKDQYNQQMPEYQGRTELLKDGFTNGSVDLKIASVRLSDEGQYTCFIQDDVITEEAQMEIKVTDHSSQKVPAWIVVLGVIMVVLFGVVILTVYFSKRKGKHVKEVGWGELAALLKEDVTLDPDTAHPQLLVSEDQKSVRWADTRQDLPDNPGRFDSERCVLGCERFSAGGHYWEVEVGHGKYWVVGVARESVKRKGGITLNPEEGIWSLAQWGGQYKALTAPVVTPLSLSQVPRRIRVCLDYDEGKVEFFNADTKAPIFTFLPVSFAGERLCPWLWVGQDSPLRLCP
ncbi:butyrophilin subfamily 1 member A1 isoform X2 [Alligator mississippiensis]|uniref:butyrophilin subfamily 1 member A1 isoform X2 n=1 Tax=Alligator mississippiensis TaxID=8496 RepID=UPI0009073A19|nr:butyrophilin subfamily 1 member A1 isoform X2 [Alligator mississippiensis]